MNSLHVIVGAVALTVAACSAIDAGQPTESSSSALGKPNSDGGNNGNDGGNNGNHNGQNKPQKDGFVQILPGSASAFAVAAGDASPWVIGTDSVLYHYNNDYLPAGFGLPARTFVVQQNDPATAFSLSVSPEGVPWKITSDNPTLGGGFIFEHAGPPPYENANAWSPIGSQQALEIAVGANEQAWIISNAGTGADHQIYYWSAGAWQPPQGLLQQARHIAVSPDGANVYAVDSSGIIYKGTTASSGNFATFSPVAIAFHSGDTPGRPVLGAGNNDWLWVIDTTSGTTGNAVEYFSPISGTWTTMPAYATTISVSADGTPWLVDSNNNIFEYVTQWQSVGPTGFQFQESPNVWEWWTGWVNDIDVNVDNSVSIAARGGGAWQIGPQIYSASWNGSGVGWNGTQYVAPAGPVAAVSTVAVSPNNSNYMIVGTGVVNPGMNGPDGPGNGAWWTSAVRTTPNAPWNPSRFFTGSTMTNAPTKIVKIRYGSSIERVWLITPTSLYTSTDNGHTFHLSASSSCVPHAGHSFTDLVVDPRNAAIAYVGVSGEGVYQATGGGASCNPSNPPFIANGNVGQVTSVALAISASSQLYAAFAGGPSVCTMGTDYDFQNIDVITAWPHWAEVVDAVANNCTPTLTTGGGHGWALGTDPSGSILLLGGVGLFRGTGCGPGGCSTFQAVTGVPEHADYHSIRWMGAAHNVFVGNDGGDFHSTDDGVTWAPMNFLPITLEDSVAVNGTNIFATAWDVGPHWYTNTNSSYWYGGIAGDGAQAVADLRSPGVAYFAGNEAQKRYLYNSTGPVIQEIDNPQAVVGPPSNFLAMGSNSPVLTIARNTSSQQDANLVLQMQNVNNVISWSPYTPLVPAQPYSISASNENIPAVYVSTGAVPWVSNTLYASIGGGAWANASPPSAQWSGYHFAYWWYQPGHAAAFVTDPVWNDLYALGTSNYTYAQPMVWKSAAPSHGASWGPLTGTNDASPGVPGRLKQDEVALSVYPDPASRAVVVGTDGTAGPSGVYGTSNTVWRLNNADVGDANHHWRPWVNGLGISTLPVAWVTGQYEAFGDPAAPGGQVFYMYVATTGGGIWKREVRGGDM
jgi:hypothetical protein